MRFLIDTHCWLWAISAPERLNPEAAELLGSDSHTIVVSAISTAEIAVKASIGKLRFDEPVDEFVSSRIEAQGMKPLPLYVHHALRVAELPLHHRDPFDRLLVAQAQMEGLPLMTADPKLAAYDVDIIWAGRDPEPVRTN
jgi:PIN domain nuclease of toxin-antitoxin system